MPEPIRDPDEILQKLREITEEKELRVLQKDVRQSEELSMYHINKHFGSFSAARKEAGLGDDMLRDRVEQVLTEHFEEHREIPTTNLIKERDDVPGYSTVKRIFDVDDWDEALRAVGLDPEEKRRELTMEGLKELSEEHGRSPPYMALKHHDKIPHPEIVEDLYGSIDEAYEAAGLTYGQRYERSHLAEDLAEFVENHDGDISATAIDVADDIACYTTYYLHFDSLENALQAAGVEQE